MSNLTRTIEKYIHELFESEGDESIVSLRRKEPSKIGRASCRERV